MILMVGRDSGPEEAAPGNLEKYVSLMRLRVGLLVKQTNKQKKPEEILFNEKEETAFSLANISTFCPALLLPSLGDRGRSWIYEV